MRHLRGERVDAPPEPGYNVHVLTIRRETADDAEAVAGVQVRTWQAAYAGIMPAELLAALDRAAWAERRRHWCAAYSDQFTTLVAEADDVIVGFATIGPYPNRRDNEHVDPGYGEILAIYVEPWSRPTGAPASADGSWPRRWRN